MRYRMRMERRHHRSLEEILESQRQLYNAALEERRDKYAKTGEGATYYTQCKALTECRRDLPEMAALPLSMQRGTIKRLDGAFQNFFKRVQTNKHIRQANKQRPKDKQIKLKKPGYPRFKGKGWFKTISFRNMHGISYADGRISSPAFGSIRLMMHRPLPEGSDLKHVNLTRDRDGRWWAGLVVAVPTPPKCVVRTMTGIDLGIDHLATLSNGEEIPNPKFLREAQAALRVAQRALARTQPNSSGRRKARFVVGRCHRKVRNRRRTYLDAVAAHLVASYDLIVLEDLNIGNMLKNHCLALSISDASWGELVRRIKCKAASAGVWCMTVPPHWTSQDCSGCAGRVIKGLSQRWHSCPHCGTELGRDHNAARNVLRKYLLEYAQAVVGLGELKPGIERSAAPDEPRFEIQLL